MTANDVLLELRAADLREALSNLALAEQIKVLLTMVNAQEELYSTRLLQLGEQVGRLERELAESKGKTAGGLAERLRAAVQKTSGGRGHFDPAKLTQLRFIVRALVEWAQGEESEWLQ